MTETPADWHGAEVPAGFVDPRDNPALPAITFVDADFSSDPTPPAERIVAVESRSVELLLKPLGASAPCAIPGINLDSWTSPGSRGWGQSCNVQLARITLAEAALSVNVLLAELVWLIMAANEAQGYRYRKADTGCYNCRSLRVGTDWSWHAWALAIDANWTTNPMRYPVVTDRPAWERARWMRYGFGWGGDYDPSNPPDAMHTEFHGTPTQAQAALELARAELTPIINGGGQPPAPAPTPPPADDAQVRKDQFDLNDTGFPCEVDGVWGPKSQQACKDFQFAARIGVDGVCGPDTRNHLHMVPSWHYNAPSNLGGYPLSRWIDKLQEHGWHIADGASWARFRDILRQFQADKGIPSDGWPGPQSWTTLFCTRN